MKWDDSIRLQREIADQCYWRQAAKRNILLNLTRPTTRSDYEVWLSEFLKTGGTPTHYYDYEWSRWDRWRVAYQNVDIPQLYGSYSLCIIVLPGIVATSEDETSNMPWGHNNIYWMTDGQREVSFRGTVPVFADLFDNQPLINA